MDLAILAASRSPAGAALLAEIGSYDQERSLAMGARLRARHPAASWPYLASAGPARRS